MDSNRLDALTKGFARRLSRRKAVVAGVVGMPPLLGNVGHSLAHDDEATPGAQGVQGTPSASGASGTPGASPVAAPTDGRPPAVRKNAKLLSDAEKRAYVDAVLALKATPSPWAPSMSVHGQFAFWHREAFDCALMAAHMGPGIWPWHRMFLLLYEQQLQRVDPSVTLPYWDWAVDNQPDSYLWQDDLMGGNGDPDQDYAVTTGPFRKGVWDLVVFDVNDALAIPHLVRDLGAGGLAPTLPTAADVAAALAVPTYDVAPWNETSDPARSFRNHVEGWRDCAGDSCVEDPFNHPKCTGSHDMHNRVHLWVSGEFAFAHQGLRTQEGPFGTMAFNSSPNDPVFFLHHANIDRIWSAWMARHGQRFEPTAGAMAGHNLDDQMWPFVEIGIDARPGMLLSDLALGYVYDSLP